jgi:hypothetical protein
MKRVAERSTSPLCNMDTRTNKNFILFKPDQLFKYTPNHQTHWITDETAVFEEHLIKYGRILQYCDCNNIDKTHYHRHYLIEWFTEIAHDNFRQTVGYHRKKAKIEKKKDKAKNVKCAGHFLNIVHYFGCKVGQQPSSFRPQEHIHYNRHSICTHTCSNCETIRKDLEANGYGEIHSIETYNKYRCECIPNYEKERELRNWGRHKKNMLEEIEDADAAEIMIGLLEAEKEEFINKNIRRKLIAYKINQTDWPLFKFVNYKA